MKLVITCIFISFVVGLCCYDIVTSNFYGDRATSTMILIVIVMLPIVNMIEQRKAS
ncbi:hypothetical protein [Bacillus sp. REN10]|uniref:hypothetical protein n=1 Tax=Bacillus sp. REN10 TaxID=2782541 RepID=UPI00193C0A63|nr:hypothetical protein [Bacillus sp. REN10]